MDLQQALTEMHAAGIRMRACGDRLSVASRAPLTEPQRAWIRAHKAELLRLLAEVAPSPPDVRALDGGESRVATSGEAPSAMRVYRYRLIDKPDTWLTMIAPDGDLEAARRSLRLHFGERLTDVAEHPHRRLPR